MAILPDVLPPHLKVVFCGTAAGRASARAGAYYAGPGNRFWETLHRIGLTPHQLHPAEDPTVARYGIGLTDIVKTAYGADADLPAAAFDAAGLWARLVAARPLAVAFNGKRAAVGALGRAVAAYGPQAPYAGIAVFVLPSTSGAARRFWDIRHWRELAHWVTTHE
jgi:TDG/mug DNA glycosylase family protein